MHSAVTEIVRRTVDRTPARVVQLAWRLREAVAPKPWPFDEAAVGLYRCERTGWGVLPHPPYLYGLLAAARTAEAIEVTAFTALEFGVAGGNGLRAMQRHAAVVKDWYGIDVTIVGLDSGGGLLASSDPRDCVFALPEGEFAMDQQALAPHLHGMELVLGDVQETVGPLAARIADGELPPLGFVGHDLDVYQGTFASLKALGALPAHALLPRVPMYFDDLSGYPYTTKTGERAAINDFNAISDTRTIGQVENLEQTLGGSARWANWPRHVHVLHAFDHPRYNAAERVAHADLSLRRTSQA